MDSRLEAVLNHEDKYSKNLNKVFDSYGCETLEAKVPIVESPTFEKMKEIDEEQQLYAALALKSESASAAVRGRRPKTKNVDLQVVELNGQLMLSTGQVRDRSPVDRDELDLELDSYMKEAARRKELKLIKDDDLMCIDEPDPPVPTIKKDQQPMSSSRKNIETPQASTYKSKTNAQNINIKKEFNSRSKGESENKPPIDEEDLDNDLDYYMKEAARLKAQKQAMLRICPDRDIINEFDEDL